VVPLDVNSVGILGIGHTACPGDTATRSSPYPGVNDNTVRAVAVGKVWDLGYKVTDGREIVGKSGDNIEAWVVV